MKLNLLLILLPLELQIPGDMVVNSILASIIAHVKNDEYYYSEELIYHISSSKINPLKTSNILLFLYNYFTKNPWMNKDGNIIKVGKPTLFSSMDSFRKYISTYYWPLLKVCFFLKYFFSIVIFKGHKKIILINLIYICR